MISKELIKTRRKAQMSFFAKVLFIVAASIAFVLVIIYNNSFRKSTTEERELSNFKMETMNVLQKLVNDKSCLAYAYNETPQKGIIDINKLKSFVSKYGDVEPECAKALEFDYNIEIKQFPKNFTLLPGEKTEELEVDMEYLCSQPQYDFPPPGHFYYIACNYNPQECQGVCDACGEFDPFWSVGEGFKCKDEWGCGKEPLKNCPYTGTCNLHAGDTCPYGNPPGGMCCIYLDCPKDACDYVISAGAPGHSVCYVAYGNCNLTKCDFTSDTGFHGHCARGTIEIPTQVGEIINVTIPVETWGFGVGFGTSSFSPKKAKYREIQLSLPVTIKYNETFSAEGIIYIHTVQGELEELYSLIEDLCEKAKINPNTEISLSREMHFSLPVSYFNGNLCMLNACKRFECPYPLNFDNIKDGGDYMIEFSYNSLIKEIKVMK